MYRRLAALAVIGHCQEMGCEVTWRAMADGVDGLLIDDDRVIVACSEVLYAYDRATGDLVWDAGFAVDTGDGPVHGAASGDLVLIGLESGPAHAFCRRDGTPEPSPGRRASDLPAIGGDRGVWPGLTFVEGILALDGHPLWKSLESGQVPRHALLGRYLVVNEFRTGVEVIDTRTGDTELVVELGTRNYDESAVFVQGREAFTAMSDGQLIALRYT